MRGNEYLCPLIFFAWEHLFLTTKQKVKIMAKKEKYTNFTLIPNGLLMDDALKMQLYALIKHYETSERKTCSLSMRSFCELTHSGEKQIRKALKSLEAEGYIVSVAIKGETTCRNTTIDPKKKKSDFIKKI